MSNQPATLAIIEDNIELGQAYKERLQAEGFRVVHISNGEDALASVLETHPDLIILDLKLPRISGFDVLDILKNTKQTAHIPVLILTALSDQNNRHKAASLGADAYLVKSSSSAGQIISKVKQLLPNHLK